MAKTITAVLKLDNRDFKNGLSDTSKAIVGISASITALGASILILTKGVANYQDEMIKTARRVGTTAEEFSKLTHAANLSGLSNEALIMGLKRLAAPTDAITKSVEKYGLSLKGIADGTETSIGFMKKAADKMNTFGTAAQKTAFAVGVFGEEVGARMVSMLSGGSKGIAAMTEEAVKLGLVVSTQAGEAAEKFNDDLTKMQGALKGVANAIGESIIAFSNQDGSMTDIMDSITELTADWRELDSETKNNIITFGTVIIAIAFTTLALAGIVAIAPAVGAAFSFMFGPIGLIITAIGLLIFAVIKFKDQILPALQPVIDSFSRLAKSIKDSFGKLVDDIKSVIKPFKEFFNISNDTGQQISILGTVALVVFKAIATAIRVTISPFILLFKLLKGIAFTVLRLGQAMQKVFSGNFKDAQKFAKKALDEFTNIGPALIKEAEASAKDIQDIWSSKNLVFEKIEIPKIEAPKIDTPKFPAPEESDPEETKKVADTLVKDLQKFVALATTAIQPFSSLAESAATAMNRVSDIFQRDAEIILLKFSEAAQKQIDLFTETEQEKLEILADGFDDQIQELKDSEAIRIDILENGMDARLLLLNEEFQDAKKLRDDAFALEMEDELIQFEIKKEQAELDSADKEQRRQVELQFDEDWKDFQEMREKEHDKTISDLQKEFNDAKTKDEKDTSKEITDGTKIFNTEITDLQDEKNTAIEDATDAFNTALSDMNTAKNKEEEKQKKASNLALWEADVAAWEATKNTQTAMAIATGLSSAIQASVSIAAAGLYNPIAVAAGITVSGLILAATAAQVKNIRASKPIKPASLSLATGGVIEGPPHSRGGINVNLEGGEGVINRERTQKIENFIDNATTEDRSIVINIQPGAIVTNGNFDERTMDDLAFMLARRIEGVN